MIKNKEYWGIGVLNTRLYGSGMHSELNDLGIIIVINVADVPESEKVKANGN